MFSTDSTAGAAGVRSTRQLKQALETVGLKEILDPKNPMASARKIVEQRFTQEGLRTLWRHKGAFWEWNGSYYKLTDDETLRAHVWEYLDNALRPDQKPFKPLRANVSKKPSIPSFAQARSLPTSKCHLST